MKGKKITIGGRYLFTDRLYGHFNKPFVVEIEGVGLKDMIIVYSQNNGRMWVKEFELNNLL